MVSHAVRLIAAIESASAEAPPGYVTLEKRLGETHLAEIDARYVPPWHWPAR